MKTRIAALNANGVPSISLGLPARQATQGGAFEIASTLKGLWRVVCWEDTTLSGLFRLVHLVPRVGAARQPWAEGWNAFGVRFASVVLAFVFVCFDQPVFGGGHKFLFTITADSHLDEHTDRGFYQRTLKRAAADKPAFHVDLGDTFMTEKHTNRADAAQQYTDQRRYFDLLGVPVHLVIGNHDGECGRYLDGTTNNLAVWSRAMRMRYFPEPLAPDGRNYYAWETNNALFIALDPFWFSPRARRNDDNWFRTLGKEQYDWLKRTLETSRAKFKFVFIHHLVGGGDRQGRGGVEVAPFYEWGGKNADGTDGFAAHRPGWAMPIHQLLVTNHVAAVFHGHDHLYARQELDGIVYQEVPQPGDPRGSTRSASEYGYKTGVMLGSSGYLRVTVSPEQARVDCVRTKVGEQCSIAHSYQMKAR